MIQDTAIIHFLAWANVLFITIILALVGFMGTRAYAYLQKLNDTLFSFKSEVDKGIGNTREWVLTDFVTKDDHERAMEDIKEQMKLCSLSHKK